MRGKRLSLLGLWSPGLGRGKTSLVAWLLCFFGFWIEPQCLSLGFYYSCSREGSDLPTVSSFPRVRVGAANPTLRMPNTDLKDTNNQNFVISRNNKGDSHIHPAHELIGQGLTEIKITEALLSRTRGLLFHRTAQVI